MGKEQKFERRGEASEGVFACVERWWGRLPIVVRISSIPILFVGLVAIWFMVSAEFAQFLGYVVGGVFLLWQIFISSQRAKAAEETARSMQQTVELTEKGNIAERFKNAIEHLGHESSSVRLGGIYALHYIAKDKKNYRHRVFEILCAHIKETTTRDGYEPRKLFAAKLRSPVIRPTIEIESILNLLFVRVEERKIYEKYFSAHLENANLRGAALSYANLHGASLLNAEMQEAQLVGANLRGANLFSAKMQEAYLFGANLRGAFLGLADLQNSHLEDANLQGADLSNVQHLQIEQLLATQTLYDAELSYGMEEEIRRRKPGLFEDPTSVHTQEA